MLRLLKKKSDSSAGPAVPAWHPNFRDYEKLPDVKVVRTAFFLNGAAVAVVVALGLYVGIHEWQLHTLNVQIAQQQKLIDRDKKPSERAVILFKQFQTEAAKAEEVDAFVKSRPQLSGIFLHLAQTLPENIALDAFEMRANGFTLRMTIRGTPEVAAGYATAYLDQLRNDTALTAFDRTKFEFTNQARNSTTGRLAVEFFLRFNAEYADKKL
jgi:Tfp pilus assembly protein PilN